MIEQIVALVDLVKLKVTPKIHGTIAVVIDTLMSKQEFYTVAMKTRLDKIVESLKSRTGVNCILMGITEATGALPGLEKIYDLVERILPGYENLSQIAHLFLYEKDHLLGHDPNREPDAQGDIFQVLVYSDENAEVLFLLDVFQEQSRKQKNSGKGNPTDTTDSKRDVTQDEILNTLNEVDRQREKRMQKQQQERQPKSLILEILFKTPFLLEGIILLILVGLYYYFTHK